MTAVLKFRWDTTDLSLIDTGGFYVDDDGWIPKVATSDSPVIETLHCQVFGTSENDLATNVQALTSMQERSHSYTTDRTVEHPVWLYAKLDAETGERRAHVLMIAWEWGTPHYSAALAGFVASVTISAKRMPDWEDTSITAATAAGPAAGIAAIYDYTAGGGDVAGDVPARIADSYARPNAAGDELDRMWVGFRSANKHGTLANFEPIWECEDGTNDTDAADVVDATASGGDIVRVTPGTATWAKRMYIHMGNVVAARANYADNLGRFLWLLRAKVSAGKWEIALRFGYSAAGDDSFVRGPIVEVESTSWNFYNMGQAAIPMRDMHTIPAAFIGMAYEGTWTIQVWARRTDGAGTLDLDCLCPIPLDEGWAICSGETVTYTAADDYGAIYFASAPEGSVGAVATAEGGATPDFAGVPVFRPSVSFGFPIGDGRAYITYARASTSDITDTIYLLWKHYDRWRSLRGAE